MRRSRLHYEAKYPDLTGIHGLIEPSREILWVLLLDTNGVSDELELIIPGNGLVGVLDMGGLSELGLLSGQKRV